MKIPKLALVLPAYNEEEVLPETISRLTIVLDDLILKNEITDDSFMVFVDDGSKDKTWILIEGLSKVNKFVKGLKLSFFFHSSQKRTKQTEATHNSIAPTNKVYKTASFLSRFHTLGRYVQLDILNK